MTSKLSLAIPQPLWENASTLTLPHSQPQFGKASEKSMHVPLVGDRTVLPPQAGGLLCQAGIGPGKPEDTPSLGLAFWREAHEGNGV